MSPILLDTPAPASPHVSAPSSVVPSGLNDPSQVSSLFKGENRDRIVPAYPLTHSERQIIWGDFQPLVKRLIRQYGDTPDLREELVGEIYSRFIDLLEAYDPARGIALYAYLVRKLSTTTYSYARSQWRRRQNKEQYERSWEEQEESGLEIGAEWVNPIEEEIKGDFEAERLRQMRVKIQGLTERQRVVLTLRYYEGKSFEEIAEKLDVKPATVRSLLRHALNNLRSQLSQIEQI